MGPLDLLPAEEPGPLDRLLGRRPERAAWVALHNAIAAAANTREFGPETRARIERAYDADLTTDFLEERLDLYGALLDAALAEGTLTGRERRELAHVAHTLALGPEDLAPLHDAAFGRAVGAALSDGCLSVEERLLLYAMQQGFGLGPEAEAGYAAAARERLVRSVARALCDGALSPEEDRAIHERAEALDVPVPAEVEQLLARGRRAWQYQHQALVALEVRLPVKPRKGERCYFVSPAAWRAFGAQVNRRSSPPSLSPTGMARAEERAEQARRARTRDVGRLYLTNFRLILDPPSGNQRSLVLRRLVGVRALGDVTLLLRENTRQYVVHPRDRAGLLPIAIERLLRGEA